MKLTNKGYINKTRAQRAKVFADKAKKIIMKNNKHFIIMYEDDINPSKSCWSFDCIEMTARDIVGIFKQIIMNIIREKKLRLD